MVCFGSVLCNIETVPQQTNSRFYACQSLSSTPPITIRVCPSQDTARLCPFSLHHMAPTSIRDNLLAIPTPTAQPPRTYWTKTNIILTIVSGVLFLGMIAGLLLFCIHQRAQKRNILAQQQASDEAGLLTNEDKSSMFSRHRAGSSITLCIDPESESYNKQLSTDTISLVALRITPPPPEQPLGPITHPSTTTSSTGSGISTLSSTTNTSITSSLLLSPFSFTDIDPDTQARHTPRRPRSMSISSQRARYYEATPSVMGIPPVPTIIRTLSD